MAEGEVSEITRLVSDFDANFAKLEAKLNTVIRANYDAADKISKGWKKSDIETQASRLKTLEIENKLTIARAAGHEKRVKELTEELLLEQQLQKLQRLGITGDVAQTKARAFVDGLGAAERAAESGGLGKALDKVFDSSKLAVIEEGSAKLRVFGSAIEPLGAAGIAAAVGVVVLAEAIEQVKKAGEEVGKIQIRSDKLGVGVEALQALDFAAKESHVSTEQLDQSLEGLNETLGRLRSGVGDKRLAPIAAQLGLTPEEIARYKDAGAFLPELIERINRLPSLSEKVNAAQRFGIEPLLPLILKNKEGLAELEAEYRRLGITVSGDTADKIEKGNLALERADTIAHDKIRNSLLDLQPLLVKAGTWFDDLKVHAVEGFAAMALAASNMPRLLSFGEKRYGGAPSGVSAGWDAPPGADGQPAAGPTQKQINDQIAANKELDTLQASLLTHSTHRLEVERKITDVEAKLGHAIDPGLRAKLLSAASAEDARPGESKAAAALRKAQEEQRQGEEFGKAGKDAVDSAAADLLSAKKEELQAQLAATRDEDQRAALTAQIKQLDAAHASALARRKIFDLDEDVTLGKIGDLDAQSAINTLREAEGRRRRADAIAEQTAAQVRAAQKAKEDAALAEIGVTGEIDRLRIESGLALTRKDRAALEQKILELTYQEQKLKLDQVINDKNNAYTAAQKAEAQGQLDQLNQLHPLQARQLERNSQGPLDQYLNSIQDLNTELEQDGVSAIKEFDSGMVNAALHMRNFGQVALSVIENLVAKVGEQILEQEAVPGLVSAGKAALSFFLPGHAMGSDSFGGWTKINEKGPEGVAFLPPNTKIIPNDTLRAMAGMKGMRAPSGVTVIQPLYLDARGSMTTAEFMAQTNAHADRAASQAGQLGRSQAVRDIQTSGYINNLNAS